jgi:hypothetical protein
MSSIAESLVDLPVRNNLAVSRPAMMHNIYTSDTRFTAGKATDGIYIGDFWETNIHALACMHTDITSDAWWRVDLGGSVQVQAVAVTNRDGRGTGILS